MNFEKFYYLNEAKFRDSKKVEHLYDVPMFSIFLDKKSDVDVRYLNTGATKEIFAKARNRIQKLGFPSMHTNVVVADLSKEANQNTGGGVGGYADHKGRFMAVSYDLLVKDVDYSVSIIVHEWAHLWMYNNGHTFRKAVGEYYKLMKDYSTDADPILDTEWPLWEMDHQLQDDTFTHIVDQLYKVIDNIYTTTLYKTYPPDSEAWGEDYWVAPYNNMGSDFENSVNDIIRDGCKMMDPEYKSYQYDAEVDDQAQRILGTGIYQKITDYVNDCVEDIKAEDPEKDPLSFDYTGKREVFGKGLSPKNYDARYHLVFDIDPDIVTEFLASIDYVLKLSNNAKNIGAKDFSGSEYSNARSEAMKLGRWANEYGMSNEDELWATGVEHFTNLPKDHKKRIMNLMQVTGSRNKDNRRMRQHKKGKYQALDLGGLMDKFNSFG